MDDYNGLKPSRRVLLNSETDDAKSPHRMDNGDITPFTRILSPNTDTWFGIFVTVWFKPFLDIHQYDAPNNPDFFVHTKHFFPNNAMMINGCQKFKDLKTAMKDVCAKSLYIVHTE